MRGIHDDGRGGGDFLHHVPPQQIALHVADALLDLRTALRLFGFVAHFPAAHAQVLVVSPPLAHEILNARPCVFLDNAPLEERRTQALYTRRAGDSAFEHGLGILDAAAIEKVWGRDAIHVVLDPVGGSLLEQNLRLLATGGRIVVIATMGGARSEIDLSLLMHKRAAVVGSTLRARSRIEKARLVSRFRAEVLPGFDDGRLGVVVDAVYAPARAGDAFQRMRDNQSVGKLLISWS